MNLLIVTQKVDKNAPILGFFHRWLQEFSLNFRKIKVICLEQGKYDLPSNIDVLSLGKEEKKSRFLYVFRFFKYIFLKKKDYDYVLVHMCPIYLILGGFFWRVMGKKISLWYTHNTVTLKLRLAVFMSDKVFTASDASLSLKTDKKTPVGHGIDTERFKFKKHFSSKIKKIIAVGRISPIKNYEDLIKAAVELPKYINVEIIGLPRNKSEKKYKDKLKKIINNKNLSNVNFIGSVPNNEIPNKYQEADILVNSSDTNSVDKVVLEAMSTGVIPVTSNESFRDMLKDFSEMCLYDKKDVSELVENIIKIINLSEKRRKDLARDLRNIVIENHNIKVLVNDIKNKLREIN